MASPSVVVIETPKHRKLSGSLTALLADASIAKIFCGAKGDIRSLKSRVVNYIDLQEIISGSNASRQLGLSQIISLTDPRKQKWTKQSFGKNRWWKLRSGPAMLREPGFVQYAAADAWGTGRAYAWFLQSRAAVPLVSCRSKAPAVRPTPIIAKTPVRATSPKVVKLCEDSPRRQLRIPLRRAPIPKANVAIVGGATPTLSRLDTDIVDTIASNPGCGIAAVKRAVKQVSKKKNKKKFTKKKKRRNLGKRDFSKKKDKLINAVGKKRKRDYTISIKVKRKRRLGQQHRAINSTMKSKRRRGCFRKKKKNIIVKKNKRKKSSS